MFIYLSLFIHCPIELHLGYLQFFAIKTAAAKHRKEVVSANGGDSCISLHSAGIWSWRQKVLTLFFLGKDYKRGK